MPHLRLPVWSEQGWIGPEEVEVQEVARGRFEIACPPRFVHGLAVGDELELDSSLPAGFRVTRHSHNLTVWVYCESDEEAGELAAGSATVLAEVGAVLEGTPPQMIIITVPLASGWVAIERAMNTLVSTSPGASWEFSNVYRPDDGVTLLNWWTRA